MNITDILLGNQNSSAISQMAQKLGISEEQARAVIAEVTPALTRGMQHNTQSDNGREGLIEALRTGNHSRYVEQPEAIGTQENIDDGNSILGHIFGSKDVSRNVAARASEETGIASALVKKALPMVATMVMAYLGKSMFGGSAAAAAPAPAQSGGLLTTLLDSDRDGSVIDDVLGMAFKMAFR